MHELTNSELTEKAIPTFNADWNTIGRFALTFNGYAHWGSMEKCVEVAKQWERLWQEQATLPDTLTNLRTCLFFEQRSWRHMGYVPSEQAMVYIHALVEMIHLRVAAGELD